jgi:hypothetical protein
MDLVVLIDDPSANLEASHLVQMIGDLLQRVSTGSRDTRLRGSSPLRFVYPIPWDSADADACEQETNFDVSPEERRVLSSSPIGPVLQTPSLPNYHAQLPRPITTPPCLHASTSIPFPPLPLISPIPSSPARSPQARPS